MSIRPGTFDIACTVVEQKAVADIQVACYILEYIQIKLLCMYTIIIVNDKYKKEISFHRCLYQSAKRIAKRAR